MILPLLRADNRPSAYLRNSVKAGALLCLVGSSIVYHNLQDVTQEGLGEEEGIRKLQISCDYPNAVSPGLSVVYIL